jgi:hypothetical protein
MICEDVSTANQVEKLQMSRDSKKKYFGAKEFKRKRINTKMSISTQKYSTDELGSFVDFDTTEEKDVRGLIRVDLRVLGLLIKCLQKI